MNKEQVMIVRIQEEEYAIPITVAKEILRYQESVKLEDAPDYLEGAINVRGTMIPIVRLSAKFGLTGDYPEDRRIIIGQIGQQEIGIVVDEVVEVLNLSIAKIEPVCEACNELGACIKGVGRIGNRLIILLDVARIFSDDELTIFRMAVAGMNIK